MPKTEFVLQIFQVVFKFLFYCFCWWGRGGGGGGGGGGWSACKNYTWLK